MNESSVASSEKSHRYSLNTDNIRHNINKDIMDFNETIETDTLFSLLEKITFDVGRVDFTSKWFSIFSLAISMIFLLLTSVGSSLFNQSIDQTNNYVVFIIEYITHLVPDSNDVLITLLVNLFISFLFISLINYNIYTLIQYKDNRYPSTQKLNFWIFISRCILPIFTCYFSYLLWKGVRLILQSHDRTLRLVYFIFGFFLSIADFLLLYLSDRIWQTTPIIRKNDYSQLWFGYCGFSFKIHVTISIIELTTQIAILVGGFKGTIIFLGVVCAISIFAIFWLIRNLPFIQPATCSMYVTVFMQCIIFSINPLLSYFLKSNISFIFVFDILGFIIIFFISRCIVARRSLSVVKVFNSLYTDHEESESELITLMAERNDRKKVDYSLLGLKYPYTVSLMMRVGYLYQMDDVTSLDFIKYAVDNFNNARIYYCAAQIAYELQTNLIYIGEVQKMCTSTSAIPNSQTFIKLFNELRQELLTQFNKPLLEGLHLAKKSGFQLKSIIGDFWGAVLKQKLENMADVITMITNARAKASNSYQRMLRDFPNSNIVLRETTAFYHNTMGDHIKAMECHILSKKGKEEENLTATSMMITTDTLLSTTTGGGGTVDKTFANRMDPSISAQEVFKNMPSGPSKCLTFVFVMTFLLMFVGPIITLTMGVFDMRSFTNTFDPVKVFSDALYAITRIPQLIRRYHLFLNGQIVPWTTEIGPVRGTNLEFIPASNCTPAIKKYVQRLRDLSVSMIRIAKTNSAIEKLLSAKDHKMKTKATVSEASSFEMLVLYTNMAENLLNISQDKWMTVNTTEEAEFIFDNVDELISAMKRVMTITNHNVIQRQDEFEMKADILHAIAWAVPVFIIIPFLLIVIKHLKLEINFILKLFFGFPKNEISILRWSMKAQNSKKKLKENENPEPKAQSALQSSITKSQTSEEVSNKTDASEQTIETLATTPRTHTGMYSKLIKSILLYTAISSTITSIGIVMYKSAMLDILNVSYGYVMATDSTATAIASYVWGQETFSRKPMNNKTLAEAKNLTWYYVNAITRTFDSFLYTSDDGMKAALLLDADVINAYVTSTSVNQVSDKFKPMHGFLHSVYFSLSCETQLRLLWETSYFIMNASDPTEYTFDQDNFTYQYEHLIFSHLDYCLTAGEKLLLSKTDQLETKHLYKMLLLFFSLFAVQFLYYFTFTISAFFAAKSHHSTVHGLMLLIPPEFLLKNQMVLKWISGSVNYKTYNKMRDSIKSKESSNISYDFIVNNSKSGLILMDADLKITQTNTTVCTMLKLEPQDLLGQNLIEILEKQLNDKEIKSVLHTLTSETNKMKSGRSKTQHCTVRSSIMDKSNQMMYLTLIVMGHSNSQNHEEESENRAPATSFSVIVVDSTAEHFQAALVASEKAKGEKLIESLLPPSIIKRMNEGETDITFEVQQATVLFTSIVAWSNLTQDMKATQVMSILNSLFIAYDEELHNFPAITKMKTIGHIYMCCGGLFSDSTVNSGQVVVEYAVKLLEIAQKVSKDLGINFQITVGVNTGGPIKCGILGVTRPVFDIIGDVVNVASRMNLHCLPGYVQISPTTYESIKYLNFNIKERGEIQVKGKGMMKTYVVSQGTPAVPGVGSAMNLAKSFV